MTPEEAARPDSAGDLPQSLPDRAPKAGPLVPAPRDIIDVTSPGGTLPAPRTSPMPSGAALVQALKRRWLLAFAVGALLGAVIGTIVWFLKPAQYTSYALLRVASQEPRVLPDGRPASFNDWDVYTRTQIVLIQSRRTIHAALKQESVRREVPQAWEQPDPIAWLQDRVRVYFIDGTEVMRIEISGEDAAPLATLVNAVKTAYMEQVVDAERNEKVRRLGEVAKIYDVWEGKLRLRREQLKGLGEQLKIPDPNNLSTKQKIALEMIAATQKELIILRTEMRKAEVDAAMHKWSQQEGEVPVPEVLVDYHIDQDPQVQDLLEAISKHEVRLKAIRRAATTETVAEQTEAGALKHLRAELAKVRFERRPVVTEQLRKRIRSEAGEVVAAAKRQIEVLGQYEQRMQKDLDEQSKLVEKFGSSTFELQILQSDIDQATKMVDQLRAERQRQELEVLAAAPRVREYMEAEVPTRKDLRAQFRSALMAGLGAFFVGMLFVGFWEFRTRRIGTADEVTSDLGLRVLGTLPALSGRGRALPGNGATADRYWRNVLTESVDSLRAVLTRSEPGTNQVLMITSARDREGKTMLATFLASSLTRAGRRTLLIDGDLRHPSIHELLALPGEPGLSEVIRGETAVEDVIQLEEVTGLSVLPAGQCDSQTIQALSRYDLGGLIERLRPHFDFIIIDSCPVLPVADSLLVAPHVDSVLLSIRFPVSRVPQVYAAYERLRAVGARVMGTVVQGAGGDFFGYQYKYFAQSRALP